MAEPTLQFDYVILGAGSAGCVLADRLSESGQHRVLLVEAGPEDASRWIHLPLGLQIALRDARLEWRLPTAPEPALKGRAVPQPRGRTLGGTSSMNGMIYIRGQAEDYDAWAHEHGCHGWAWADVLPYFLKSEGNRDLPAGALHGREGPLAVTTSPQRSGAFYELCNTLIAAGREMGLPANADFNGPTQEGVGYYQHTLAGGQRFSTARAYLRRARGRHNLTVWTDASAERLLFSDELPLAGSEPGLTPGGNHTTTHDRPRGTPPRATGVALLRAGTPLQVRALREVIVCTGALHSPQLLQVSGIGPAAHLQHIGVPVRVDAPDVGRHLQDHVQARLRYRLTQPVSLNDLYHRRWLTLTEGLKYLLAKRGRFAQAPIRAGAFCKSAHYEPRPDLQFHFIEFTSDGMGQPPHREPGFQTSVCLLRPASRGEVMATAPTMATPPRICGHYLSDAGDVQRTLRGVHIARELAAQPALQGLIAEEAEPGPGRHSDEALIDWMRGNAVNVYHPVGTCRMGGDTSAVLDAELRVRGVVGLRVVDASVMPALVSGNTNAPTIMLAEKAADLIRAAAAR